jgi:hypothetical protein
LIGWWHIRGGGQGGGTVWNVWLSNWRFCCVMVDTRDEHHPTYFVPCSSKKRIVYFYIGLAATWCIAMWWGGLSPYHNAFLVSQSISLHVLRLLAWTLNLLQKMFNQITIHSHHDFPA